MRIAVDIDDTLNIVDRVGRAGAYIAARKLPFKLKDPYSNMFVNVYDWTLDDVLEFVHAGGIAAFTDAAARKGAKEALASWRAAGHEIVILTSRLKEWFVNPERVSRDWLEKRRIPYDALVAEVTDKAGYCAEHKIDILIDDNADTCAAAQAAGVYAVLAVGRHNLLRAHEVAFGGANWRQIAEQTERVLRILAIERLSSRADGTSPFYAAAVPKGDLAAGVAACEARAAAFGKPCRFRLTAADVALDGLLEKAGYPVVKTCAAYALDKIPAFSRGGNIRTESEPSAEWLKNYFALERAAGYRDESLRFTAARGERLFASATEGDRVVGVGFSVREGEDVGLYCLRVHPDFRRKGVGSALCGRLLNEAKRAGAKRAYLLVRAANLPALELCRSLGFTRLYDYWYREKI